MWVSKRGAGLDQRCVDWVQQSYLKRGATKAQGRKPRFRGGEKIESIQEPTKREPESQIRDGGVSPALRGQKISRANWGKEPNRPGTAHPARVRGGGRRMADHSYPAKRKRNATKKRKERRCGTFGWIPRGNSSEKTRPRGTQRNVEKNGDCRHKWADRRNWLGYRRSDFGERGPPG